MKCDDSENSGAAVAIYKSNNCSIKKIDDKKIGLMKVGEGGKIARPYCTECGTVLFNVYAPNWCAANRNALTTSDGSAYKPEGAIMNVNCKSSFDKEKCPEPKSGTVPLGMLFKFIPLLAGVFCDGSNKEKALVPEDITKVEAVPITWE